MLLLTNFRLLLIPILNSPELMFQLQNLSILVLNNVRKPPNRLILKLRLLPISLLNQLNPFPPILLPNQTFSLPTISSQLILLDLILQRILYNE